MIRTLGLIFISLVFIFSSTICFAEECHSHPFLKKGFNMSNYNSCRIRIQQCPSQGPVPENSCVDQVVKQHSVCNQLKILGELLHADPSALTIEKQGSFALIDHFFTADGHHNYLIITPLGCIIDTNIDPINLNSSLKEQYKHLQLVFVNWSKPVFQSKIDKTQYFTVLIRVTKNCLACQIIGWAKVSFVFNHSGNLKNIVLESFSRDIPKKE